MEERTTAFRISEYGWPFGNVYRYAPGIGRVRLPFAVDLGFCGGMVFSALDRFYAASPIAPQVERPVQGEPLFDLLFRRQRQTLNGGVIAKTYAWQIKPDGELATLTTREWPAIRGSIDAGHPVVICLIRVKGLLGKVWDNHQVVVHGYRRDPSTGRVTLYVYDPNHRRREGITIQFTPGNRLDAVQSTGEPLRGFFVIPYDRESPPRLDV